MDWIPVKIDPESLGSLRPGPWLTAATAGEFRIPSGPCRAGRGPSPLRPACVVLGRRAAAELYVAGVLKGKLWWDRVRGPAYTPPISRKFFPPRWHR